ncbi:NAD(P)/FAD-dependent oxidoreductase [Mesorhizobium sp. M1E.F.Ca.ET.063.01.1.1]|uniref:NAD(P)/FAD-dependent oxidoreductase n=1 Tax=Mesorhizobium sp. M1E.F.Ca.ET.063.01.1.1 TaxID=2496750 RepID=UPI000FCCDA4E|nr:NAD(P)/FAD-dependent oxidoreductase [Mesorhizobium sp. M1E.F.Ca.ET.063.01.1.1]RUW86139.1 NAD(P)/FAD-dependent oxidoreductase [Mesorhizobium sp. M1E.F.Ca.ET.063.01.1.1]
MVKSRSGSTAPKIVIVGGGVAGLVLATRLGDTLGRRGRARVTLIDRSWVHVWKPMLHTFAAGTWNIYQQQVHYLAHAHAHHFEYVPGQVDSIDRTARHIRLAPLRTGTETLAQGGDLDYDLLVLAFGSRANDFGTPGVAEHCQFIDSQDQAEGFNARLRAQVVRSLAEGGHIDIGIVGGGATGVELAAELSRMVELASSYGGTDIRHRFRVTLLESGLRILGSFPEKVSTSVLSELRKLGVDVRSGVKVVGANPGGYLLDGGETIPASLKVWAAGIRASSSFDQSGLELNHAGQIVVGADLRAKGDQHIFALGDCATFLPEGGERPLPASAQVASQQALHLIRHLPAFLRKGTPVPPFRFQDFGALVALSQYNAFGTLGRFGFFKGGFIKGRFAQLTHAVLYRRHQLTLHGPFRAALLWVAERINALVQPRIRMS